MSDLARRTAAARRVLIVGDPALSRGLMRMVLGRLDYVVTCAASAREASAALQHTRFALIMVALQLLDAPGPAFARRLREGEAAQTPILLFGDAWDKDAVQQECAAAGLQGYLPKPISIGRLVAKVRELTLHSLETSNGAAPMGDEPPAPVDLGHLLSFTDGDEQLERELSTLYLATAAAYLGEMRELMLAGEPWDRAAHSLKGASANIGAGTMAEAAKDAEHATPDGDRLARLETGLDEVRRFFEDRLGQDAGLAELCAVG